MNNYPMPKPKVLQWPPQKISRLPEVQENILPLKSQGSGQAIPTPFPLKGTMGRSFTLSSTPQLIATAQYDQPILITNTAQQVGTGTGIAVTTMVFNDTLAAVGNTQASPLDVSQYEQVHAFLNITAIAGTWDLYMQAYNITAAAWVDVAIIPEFTGMTAVGNSGYALLGPAGIAEYLAFKFNPTAAGNITATLGIMVKSGVGPSIVDIPGIAYVGDRAVNSSSGFPVFPGDFRLITLADGQELWAMSDYAIKLKTHLF